MNYHISSTVLVIKLPLHLSKHCTLIPLITFKIRFFFKGWHQFITELLPYQRASTEQTREAQCRSSDSLVLAQHAYKNEVSRQKSSARAVRNKCNVIRAHKMYSNWKSESHLGANRHHIGNEKNLRQKIVLELGGFEAPEQQHFMPNNKNFIAAQNPRTTATKQKHQENKAQRIHTYGVRKHTSEINFFLSTQEHVVL